MKFLNLITEIIKRLKINEDFEPETVLEDIGADVSLKNKNLFYAVKVCTKGIPDDFFTVEKICLSLSGKEVDFDTMQHPTIENVYVLVFLLNFIKHSLTKDEIKGIISVKTLGMSEEFNKYVSSISIDENLFVSPLDEVQAEINKFLKNNYPSLYTKVPKIRSKLSEKENPFTKDTIEYFQFEKVKEIDEEVTKWLETIY